MTAEELMQCVGSLEQAAEMIEAIDDVRAQRKRGLDLSGWRYELVPWGVRFVRRERDGGDSEVFVLAVLKDHVPAPPGGVRVVLSSNERPAPAVRPV